MKSGKLVHKVGIERSTIAVTDAGEPIFAWVVMKVLRAELVENRMTETEAQSGSVTNAICTFRVRHSPISLSDRLIFEGETYRILDVKVIGRNREMEIKAELIDARD